MSPPVAAAHCGICCRPFTLYTWRQKAFLRLSSLCATRTFGGVYQQNVSSEPGGGEFKKNGFVVCGDFLFLFLTQLVREVVFCSCYYWRFVRSCLRCKSVKQVKESNRCFWWICGRLRNESSSEAPAALPAVLLLWSRAGRRHLARSGHPGTRWDLNIDTEAERACVRLLYKSVQISVVGYLVRLK